MKKIKKFSSFLLMLMLSVNMVFLPVSAASVSQDGLEVSLITDKEEYSAGEQIELVLKVKNTNTEAVSNVSLEDFIAEGYELAEGDAESLKKQIEALAAGEEISLAVTVQAKDDDNGQNNNNNQNSGNDNNNNQNNNESNNNNNTGKPDNSNSDDIDQNNNQNDSNQNNNNQGNTNQNSNSQNNNNQDNNNQSNKHQNNNTNNTNNGNSGGTNTSSTQNVVSVPKTGDNSHIALWLAILAAAVIGVSVLQFIRNKKAKDTLSLILCIALTGSTLVGASATVSAAEAEKKTITVEKTVKYNGKDATFKANVSYLFTEDNKETEEENKNEYKLVWEDNFEGTSLNRDDWNVELHEPGWVNNELQKYIDSEENIYVKDGKLIIQALKSIGEDGKISYTSGRINTQNKHDYKYGKFEVRAKVPSGNGFLPAFWMMPTNESLYGQWPKCGEIDIMEVLGSKTNVSHGTLHFGEPHTQKQGSYTLQDGDFASEFHVYAVEWDPDEFRFYVDGELFYTVNDWFTKRQGYGEIAYPAPYDQPFYMILNLAVGGDWPGNPDEDAVFAENAQLVVDYVKVYQKDSYDENVQKPQAVLREPDATGNYVKNGDFSVAESFEEESDWQFLLAGEGEATASVSDGWLKIETANPGELDYSVQMVQANIPVEQGWRYKLTFDAYADAERTMIVDISAPDKNWIRYLADTTLDLAAMSQTYTYTFDMVNESDGNGRLEFNLGNQPSIATVYIDNIRIEKVEQIEMPEAEKSVLPDGNYVYNGEFQEGTDRLSYWVIENLCNAQYTVTNSNNVREFKADIPDTAAGLETFVLKQTNLLLAGGKTYLMTFDAYADREKTIRTEVAGQTFESSLTTARTIYKYTINTPEELTQKDLKFLLGAPGTVFIDNVRIQEDGMLINGDFSNGTVGFEVYAYNSGNVDYWVDGLNEQNAFVMQIADTGAEDWHIQLKQNNITLEKDKWYKISLDAKATLDRTIMYALQRDGSADDDWTPYSGTQRIDLTGEYQTFEHVFQMTGETDTATMLSISMGAVNGAQITEAHKVMIDNIRLEETEAPVIEEVPADTNLIKNGNFTDGATDWISNAITAPGEATTDFSNGKAVYNITNVGNADWNVQLKQENLTLEQGATYTISFKIKSTAARTVKYAFLDPVNSYAWYGGEDIVLAAEEEKTVSTDMRVSNATSATIDFVISMGQIYEADGVTPIDTPVSTIEISEVSLIKKSAGSGNPSDEVTPANTNLIQNGDFANGDTNWMNAVTAPGEATADFSSGKAVYNITNVGNADWNIQLKQSGLTLEQGAAYIVSFKIKSTEARTVRYAFLDSVYSWYGGEDVVLAANEEKTVNTEMTVTNATCDAIDLVISMGMISEDTPVSTIEISEVSLIKK